MLRVGIASFWHVHAMGYAQEVKASGRAELVAAWDEDPERGAAGAGQLGIPFEPDYDRFLNGVDGLIMTAPTRHHGFLLVRAAAAKKHVFSEKVLAVSGREAKDILSAFQRAEAVLELSLPRLYDPNIRTIRQLIQDGALGRVTSMRARASHDGAVAGWLPKHFFDAALTGGGAFIDLGAHPVYVANWLLGEPIQVTARLTRIQEGYRVDDNAGAIVEYRNGAFAEVETSFVNGRHPPLSIEVHGTGGTLYFGTPSPEIWIKSSQRSSDGFERIPVEVGQKRSAMDQWLEEVLDHRAREVAPQEMIRLSQVMEAAEKSSAAGQMVHILAL